MCPRYAPLLCPRRVHFAPARCRDSCTNIFTVPFARSLHDKPKYVSTPASQAVDICAFSVTTPASLITPRSLYACRCSGSPATSRTHTQIGSHTGQVESIRRMAAPMNSAEGGSDYYDSGDEHGHDLGDVTKENPSLWVCRSFFIANRPFL